MKKIPFFTLICTILFCSCTDRGMESCNRFVDRRTEKVNYHIIYYGLMGQEMRHVDNFNGFLRNDEGIDVWYIKSGTNGVDTTIQIMRGDFGTTVIKSWK